MENNKTNLEIAKFKLEFFFILLGAGRDKEASEAFSQAMQLIGQEIEAQKEPALKFGPAEPAGPSTRDENGRAV